METLLFLLFIALSLFSSSQKKKKQAQKKQPPVPGKAAAPAANNSMPKVLQQQMEQAKKNAPARPAQRTVPRASSVGEGAGTATVHPNVHTVRPSFETGHAHVESSLTGDFEECPPNVDSRPINPVAPAARHVVAPSGKTGHAHTESSITGIEDCKPQRKPAAVPVSRATAPVRSAAAAGGFRFDPAKAREAILYSEILGKPKALRNSAGRVR